MNAKAAATGNAINPIAAGVAFSIANHFTSTYPLYDKYASPNRKKPKTITANLISFFKAKPTNVLP